MTTIALPYLIMPVMAAMIGLKATLTLATGIPPVALCTVCGSS